MADVRAAVLKLNAGNQPIGVIPWQEAITLWYKGAAEIVDYYEDIQLRSWKSAMSCPAVIRLKIFIRPKKNLKFFEPFTRRNVYKRDNGKCQYCGHELSLAKMTFDHIIPKSQGGLTNWRNIVCSCLKCNTKKNDRTPEQAGMKLIQRPYAPIIADSYEEGILNRLKDSASILNNEKWRSWIYWNVEMPEDK